MNSDGEAKVISSKPEIVSMSSSISNGCGSFEGSQKSGKINELAFVTVEERAFQV